MSYLYPPLFSRLRRYRGLWAWTMMVLLFKLVTSSACLAQPFKAPSVAYGHVATGAPSIQGSAPTDEAGPPGECSHCHGACAHHLPIPIDTTFILSWQVMAFTPGLLPFDDAFPPRGSWLRPPIAA